MSALRVRVVLLFAALLPMAARAQSVNVSSEQVVTIVVGRSALLTEAARLARVSIANPEVAEAVVVARDQLLVNGKKSGTTSVIVWLTNGRTRIYTINVTPDTESLQRTLGVLFPNERLTVSSAGGTVVLTGQADSTVIARATALAMASGATAVENMTTRPVPRQIMLQVRIAEISRSALQQVSTEIKAAQFRAGNPEFTQREEVQTLSDGLLRLFTIGGNDQLEVIIRALRADGSFKSLAEPNLLAADGQTASFLAGGEFPFPVIQGGSGQGNAITIVWKEFGVRLNFKPTITSSGAIRLRVSPEVSQLDFANGLRVQGILVPALITRRAETEVELREGQHLGIAGLMDNSIRDNANRIPGLGDIPIIGALFRGRDRRESRTELIVIVTPTFVTPTDAPQAIPVSDPATWDWNRRMRGATPSDSARTRVTPRP